MDNGKRGRGRGLRKPQTMPEPPDKDVMDKLNEERGILLVDLTYTYSILL